MAKHIELAHTIGIHNKLSNLIEQNGLAKLSNPDIEMLQHMRTVKNEAKEKYGFEI